MSLTVKVARSRASGSAMPGVGDPGLFGSIGSLIGRVASVAKVIPGPIGMAAGAVQRLVGQRPQPAGLERPISFPVPSFAPPIMPQQPAPGISAFVQRLLPGGETGMQAAPEIGAPAGYHVNKTDYFLKDGTFIPAGSRWVKNRRRNPLNPRAASKAVGRIEALKRATSRFSRITIRKKCKT